MFGLMSNGMSTNSPPTPRHKLGLALCWDGARPPPATASTTSFTRRMPFTSSTSGATAEIVIALPLAEANDSSKDRGQALEIDGGPSGTRPTPHRQADSPAYRQGDRRFCTLEPLLAACVGVALFLAAMFWVTSTAYLTASCDHPASIAPLTDPLVIYYWPELARAAALFRMCDAAGQPYVHNHNPNPNPYPIPTLTLTLTTQASRTFTTRLPRPWPPSSTRTRSTGPTGRAACSPRPSSKTAPSS